MTLEQLERVVQEWRERAVGRERSSWWPVNLNEMPDEDPHVEAVRAWLMAAERAPRMGSSMALLWARVFKPWGHAIVGDLAGPREVVNGFDVLARFWNEQWGGE